MKLKLDAKPFTALYNACKDAKDKDSAVQGIRTGVPQAYWEPPKNPMESPYLQHLKKYLGSREAALQYLERREAGARRVRRAIATEYGDHVANSVFQKVNQTKLQEVRQKVERWEFWGASQTKLEEVSQIYACSLYAEVTVNDLIALHKELSMNLGNEDL
jgi:hypothetical protein